MVAERAAEQLGLRLIAPTVAVADAPIARVLDVLRDAGYAPAAEGAGGEVVTLGTDRPRAPAGRPRDRWCRARPPESGAHTAELVRRLRAGDAAGERDAADADRASASRPASRA